jgi:predicted Zn-dependent peptidase
MPSKPELHVLPNGLALAMVELPDAASVSVGLWVGVGGRYEAAAVNGAAHFIEHMLFKGTRRRSARDLAQGVEGLGGYLNAFTSEEHTCFYAKAPHPHFGAVMDTLHDMFLNSVFAPAEIAKEREVIREELAMYTDQPHHRVEELLNAIQWPDHPLGRPLTGSEKTIASLTRAQLLAFRREHYVAPAMVLAVAGRLRRADCHEAALRLARHLPAGERRGFVPAQSSQRAPVVRAERRQTEQAQIALGIRTCSRHAPRRHALRLLNALLGENMSSRLFQLLREDRGIVYNVASSPSFFADAGDLVIAAGLEPDKLDRALRLIVAELRRLKAAAPGAPELRRARDYVIGQMDLSLENSENQMMWLGEQFLGYGRLFTAATVKRRLHQVTAAEVRAAAEAFFHPSRLNLAIVSPGRHTEAARRILARV